MSDEKKWVGLTHSTPSQIPPADLRWMDPPKKLKGDPRFHQLLYEIGQLHDAKQRDYGTNVDPLANIRGASGWGVPPWVAAMVRIGDKVRRLQRFAAKGELANESAEDSMLDIAVYALLALILYREESNKEPAPEF